MPMAVRRMVRTLRPEHTPIQPSPANARAVPVNASTLRQIRPLIPDSAFRDTLPSAFRHVARYTYCMSHHSICLGILACVALLIGCGSNPSSEGPRSERTSAAGAPSRTPSGTSTPHAGRADSIVAALRASQVERDSGKALAYLERALAQEPQQKELVWLAARLCGDVPRCEPQTYESRLRKLDPGNGVVWMGPLARAQARNETTEEAQILEALARETRFDVYWNALLSQAAVALSKQADQAAPKMLNGPLTNAINDVSIWLSAVAMPSFAGVAHACSRENVRAAQTADRCRRIGQVLRLGDTYAAEAVGIGIAQRAVPDGSPATIALTEHAAVLSYQHETARSILGQQVEREKMSAELIELMRKLRREQDVSLAVLRWAGVPLTP